MTCTSNTSKMRITPIALQTSELLLPNGLGLMKGIRALVEVLRLAFELKRTVQQKYPSSRR
jgi:hypothetical protein